MMGRTSIVVAHRLTTVEKCNRIAVISDGKIAEEGSFAELTNNQSGYFSHLATGMRKQERLEHKLSLEHKASRKLSHTEDN